MVGALMGVVVRLVALAGVKIESTAVIPGQRNPPAHWPLERRLILVGLLDERKEPIAIAEQINVKRSLILQHAAKYFSPRSGVGQARSALSIASVNHAPSCSESSPKS